MRSKLGQSVQATGGSKLGASIDSAKKCVTVAFIKLRIYRSYIGRFTCNIDLQVLHWKVYL